MRILWAVSSVGKGHITRDIAIVNQLHKMADMEVDWLAPDPAGDFLKNRGYTVLECSSRLAGSGKAYEQVFRNFTDEFNLIEYIRKDTKLHHHDFEISSRAWHEKKYDVIVGDEAFWLLSGFSANRRKKPAPFVFLTDFIGVTAMRPRIGDKFTTWMNNAGFIMSFLGPDLYVYIGSAEEIPAKRFGPLLPGRRNWAKRHCRFVKPIVNFDGYLENLYEYFAASDFVITQSGYGKAVELSALGIPFIAIPQKSGNPPSQCLLSPETTKVQPRAMLPERQAMNFF